MQYILLVSLTLSLAICIGMLWYRLLSSGIKKRQWTAMDRIDTMIRSADTSHSLRKYNSFLHVLLSILCALGAYATARQQLSVFSAIACGFMGGLVPSTGLKILESINSSRIQREAMNFFSTFANYSATGFDMFTAFRNSEPELNEPFRSIIKDMLRQYDNKVDPILCLESAARTLNTNEVKSFFKTLIYQYVEGGDYVKLTNELTDELGELIELDEQESTEDNVLRYGIYLLISVDLIVLVSFLRSNQSSLIIGTLYGEIALTFHFLLATALLTASFIKPKG